MPSSAVRSDGSVLCGGLRILDLSDRSLTDVRPAGDVMPDPAYVPIAEARTFHGARDVHTVEYPPRNGDFTAPMGEKPPYIAVVHGEPTGHNTGGYSPIYSYFTSRGIVIIDVNYGGSTGYGANTVTGCAANGVWSMWKTSSLPFGDLRMVESPTLLARYSRRISWRLYRACRAQPTHCLRGWSLVLGASDLAALAAETRDFESRYTDGLVGPLPESSALYDERSPPTHVNSLTTPVLLLQSLDDEIVHPAQAELFRDALAAKELPHACFAYEGEPHGFRRAKTIIDGTESELSFYGQVMGFEPPAVPKLALH